MEPSTMQHLLRIPPPSKISQIIYINIGYRQNFTIPITIYSPTILLPTIKSPAIFKPFYGLFICR